MSLCGNAERPRFSDLEERNGEYVRDQLSGAGVHYLAARADIDAHLRASADPFDRATADWLNVGDMRTPEGRLDALVQQAMAGRDARVYGLAYRACLRPRSVATRCAALDPRAWVALDPGNGVPWSYVYARAKAVDDQPGAREALAAMASATRFDDNPRAIAGVVAAYPARSDTELAAIFDFIDWDAHNFTSFDVTPSTPLEQACGHRMDGDPDKARQCQAIADVLFDHSDSLLLRRFGAELYLSATGDKSRLKATQVEMSKAVRAWAAEMAGPPCAQVRIYLAQVRRRAVAGDMQEILRAGSSQPRP